MSDFSQPSFIHLRCHSEYSITDGIVRIPEYIKKAVDIGMPALGLTDLSNLFGAVKFYKAATQLGIKPILGCDVWIENEANPDQPYRMALFCQNQQGYIHLSELLSKAFLTNQSRGKAMLKKSWILSSHEGLIALSGALYGNIGHLLDQNKIDEAKEELSTWKTVFGDRFYLEIQRYGSDGLKKKQEEYIQKAMFLAANNQVPLVATHPIQFMHTDDFRAHESKTCIADGYVLADQRRPKDFTPEQYFKTAEEMQDLFHDIPSAINNTVAITKRCNFQFQLGEIFLPDFPIPNGTKIEDYLLIEAKKGLDRRLEDLFSDPTIREDQIPKYLERLNFEVKVINEMGYAGYFLIVADFINWSKSNHIPVGPGRGSGAGSVVAYSLGITDLDPLAYNLLFERFLNPDRVSMPDFDIDFCQERRDEVIRYVQNKYGRDHVAQIITFGKLQARAVLRDVGRVLEMPYGQVDKICKMVPNNPAAPMTLPQAIESESELRRMIAEDPDIRRLTDMGMKLEGLYRHASTHAAGVVIGDRPLDQLIPLYRDQKSDIPVSGFNMKFVESAGLVKFDFLGLKTLTVLAMAERLVRAKGIEIDLLTIPLDDAKSYQMMGRGETTGVFQLESAGMRDVLKSMKPDTFEDIIAVVALYRPGPMDNIPAYIRRKHGEEVPDYMHPSLEGLLTETNGIIIYQEQVMQIAQVLSGYSLGGADLLRRAMGKKIQAEMDEQRQIFVDGAGENGVGKKQANEIFDQVNKFAGYGFNKSHAAAYALVAYQTAYLKANHPVEFLAASMTLDMGNTDKLNIFRQELDRLGVPLRTPDINKSDVVFSVERELGDGPDDLGAIRYALAAVKNVGEGAMQSIVDERTESGPFKDLDDFVARLDSQQVNKRQIENLTRVGAFECMVPNRRKVFQCVETIMRHANLAREERNSNQISLFGGVDSEPTPGIALPDVPEWSPMDRLKEEFDALGYYLSAHPLDTYSKSLEKLKVKRIADISASRRPGPVKLAGTLIGKKERLSAKGNRFAFVQFSDATGSFEVTLFSEALTAARDLLKVGNSLLIDAVAQFDGDEGEAKFLASRFQPLEKAAASAVNRLRVYINSDAPLEPLKQILLGERKGRGRVEIIPRLPGYKKITLELKDKYEISPSIYQAIGAIPGVLDVQEI